MEMTNAEGTCQAWHQYWIHKTRFNLCAAPIEEDRAAMTALSGTEKIASLTGNTLPVLAFLLKNSLTSMRQDRRGAWPSCQSGTAFRSTGIHHTQFC